MIYGYVSDYLPMVVLTLPGFGASVSIEFVVDTGFAGDLAIPSRLADELNIRLVKRRRIHLADGTERDASYGYVELDWNDELRRVEVLVLEGRPLLGMVLLEGSQIFVDARDGGEVTIEAL